MLNTNRANHSWGNTQDTQAKWLTSGRCGDPGTQVTLRYRQVPAAVWRTLDRRIGRGKTCVYTRLGRVWVTRVGLGVIMQGTGDRLGANAGT